MQLVATGALTNVALLLILYPEVGSMIDITLMGGALGVGGAPAAVRQPRVCAGRLSGRGHQAVASQGFPYTLAGNTGPVQEFNIQVQPRA